MDDSVHIHRDYVSLRYDYEVRYWTQRFGVPAETLREAIQAVGPSVDRVRAWLASHRP